jgi:hypothetical protein
LSLKSAKFTLNKIPNMNSERDNIIRDAVSSSCGAIGGLAGGALFGPFGCVIGTCAGTVAGPVILQQIPNFRLSKVLQQKISSDFKNCLLSDPNRFERERKDLADREFEAHRRNWEINLDNYIAFDFIKPWDLRTLSTSSEIKNIEILAEMLEEIRRPLNISVSSVNAGVMATLMSLNQKIKLYCNYKDDLIDIDYSSVNGIEQIQAVNNRIKKYDFLITPCDSFILSPGNGTDIYQSLGPINWHTQYIFKKRSDDNYHRFIAFPNSSVEMQHLLKIGIPEGTKLELIHEKRNFLKILEIMYGGDHISLWEPLASRVRNNKEFEEIKMPGYKVVFHLFARDFWHSSEFTKERLAFQDLFQNEWRICKFNQERSLDLLKRDREYISNFAIGSGF